MAKYFYDSYAIIEFINNNHKFDNYFIKEEGITLLYNLMEVYYSMIKEGGIIEAKKMLRTFSNLIINVELEDVEEAMKFKFSNSALPLLSSYHFVSARSTCPGK